MPYSSPPDGFLQVFSRGAPEPDPNRWRRGQLKWKCAGPYRVALGGNAWAINAWDPMPPVERRSGHAAAFWVACVVPGLSCLRHSPVANAGPACGGTSPWGWYRRALPTAHCQLKKPPIMPGALAVTF